MQPDISGGAPPALHIDRRGIALPVPLVLVLTAFAGVASALALPPYGLWPVLFLTVPALLAGLDAIDCTGRAVALRGFLAGFLFGFG